MNSDSWLQERNKELLLRVRLSPNAKRNEIVRVLGDHLKIRLQAPPVDGKANRLLLQFLAKALDVSVRYVVLVRGERSRSKELVIRGLDYDTARSRLLAD